MVEKEKRTGSIRTINDDARSALEGLTGLA